MAFKDMDPLQLAKFLIEKTLADQGQAEKIVGEDVDGEIILGMSSEQLSRVLGYSFGKATRLVNWFKENLNLPVEKSSFAKETKLVQSASRETVLEFQVEEKKSVVKNLPYGHGSRRKCMGKSLSESEPDPVTDSNDLYERVFGQKPAGENSKMWGKGYLESYHPKAHAAHNRNVERMRGFFLDVYNATVVEAWTSNFRTEKKSFEKTLAFIEEACVPQLEDLILTMEGGSMHIKWTAKDIMKGWFLDHKKHYSRKRLQKIAILEAEELAFQESLSKTHTYLLQETSSPDEFEDPKRCKQTTLKFPAHGKIPEKNNSENEAEDLEWLTRETNCPDDTDVKEQDLSHELQNQEQLNPDLNSEGVSKTVLIGGDSPQSSNSLSVSVMRILSGGSRIVNISQDSPQTEGSQNSNDFEHLSPQHKRHKIIPLVGSTTKNDQQPTPGAKVK
ncbi:unnamed protein product [Calypogeia fissa]